MADMTVNRADDLIKTSRELYNKLNPTSPEAKSFDAALNRLETAAKEPTLYPRGLYMTRGQLTDTQKKSIQGATDQVNKTRAAAERARAFAPDRVDKNPPAFTQPKQQPQQPPQTVQNKGEDGIKRDPGTGDVVGRDPGAKTLLEKADQKGPYGTQGRYQKAPSYDDVMNGNRVFREGDKGPGVKQVQEMLRSAGYNVGKKGADGMWGPTTQKAFAEYMAHTNNPRGNASATEINKLKAMKLENI